MIFFQNRFWGNKTVTRKISEQIFHFSLNLRDFLKCLGTFSKKKALSSPGLGLSHTLSLNLSLMYVCE